MFLSIIKSFWFIQSLGAVALMFSVIAWNKKERSSILITQSIGSVVYIIHYILLSAFTGAIMNALVIVRNLTFNLKHKKEWAKHPSLLVGFIIVLSLGGAITWQGPASILGTLGTIVGTYGMWQSDPWKMRLYIFIACVIWIPYTLMVHSYTGLVSQLIAMLAIIVAKLRMGKQEAIAESH